MECLRSPSWSVGACNYESVSAQLHYCVFGPVGPGAGASCGGSTDRVRRFWRVRHCRLAVQQPRAGSGRRDVRLHATVVVRARRRRRRDHRSGRDLAKRTVSDLSRNRDVSRRWRLGHHRQQPDGARRGGRGGWNRHVDADQRRRFTGPCRNPREAEHRRYGWPGWADRPDRTSRSGGTDGTRRAGGPGGRTGRTAWTDGTGRTSGTDGSRGTGRWLGRDFGTGRPHRAARCDGIHRSIGSIRNDWADRSHGADRATRC